MYEKLIEHWLTNVNELGFQIPLCEVLLAEGYTILHVSKHGRGEHGKDVIARNSEGELTTFQLKGGDINLGKWQEIRGEVEDLVQLPVMLPGIDATEPHQPYLVTNGELRGDAVISIREYAEVWKSKGFGFLGVWQRNELLQKFVSAHGAYVPSGTLRDFRSFVELYIADFSDRLPREKFAAFVTSLYPQPDATATATQRKRALESAILTGEYIIGQYEQAENFVSALEGWTILAALVMYAAERDSLVPAAYVESLSLITTAFDRNLDRFCREAMSSENFIVPGNMLGEISEVRGARTVLILGWLATAWLRGRLLDGPDAPDSRTLRSILSRERERVFFGSEADWPYVLAMLLFAEASGSASDGERLLTRWIEGILGANREEQSTGFPSPYWLPEQVLSLRYGKLPPSDRENFKNHSYTVHSALDMLVRRMCRQAVHGYWKRVSKLTHCDFTPDQSCDWFLWQCDVGNGRMALFPLSRSWAQWRGEVATVSRISIPSLLFANPGWILPFALTFPHRMNRNLTAAVDAIFGNRAELI